MGDALNQIAQSFQVYAPKIIAALAVLIIGWFFALIVAAIVRGGLKRTGLGRKLADALGPSVEAPEVGELREWSEVAQGGATVQVEASELGELPDRFEVVETLEVAEGELA